MPSPVTVDLSGGGGPWPAITVSGCTGTGATDLNTTFFLQPYGGLGQYAWVAASGDENISGEAGGWSFEANGVEYFLGAGEWPWSEAPAPDNGAGGTLVFTRALAAPVAVEMDGAVAVANASLVTALSGANNDVEYESLIPGRLGNDIRIRYVSPGTNNAALSVTRDGRDITVNLATNGSAQIISTAAQVKDATETAAPDLIITGIPAGNDGTGVVTAMAWTNLSGGAGGLPLPPESVVI